MKREEVGVRKAEEREGGGRKRLDLTPKWTFYYFQARKKKNT